MSKSLISWALCAILIGGLCTGFVPFLGVRANEQPAVRHDGMRKQLYDQRRPFGTRHVLEARPHEVEPKWRNPKGGIAFEHAICPLRKSSPRCRRELRRDLHTIGFNSQLTLAAPSLHALHQQTVCTAHIEERPGLGDCIRDQASGLPPVRLCSAVPGLCPRVVVRQIRRDDQRRHPPVPTCLIDLAAFEGFFDRRNLTPAPFDRGLDRTSDHGNLGCPTNVGRFLDGERLARGRARAT